MEEKAGNRSLRYLLVFAVLLALLVFLAGLNLLTGSVALSPSQIGRILLKHSADETMYNIIWKIRLPRMLSAAVLGGALALSGFLLQTFFNNPIAGPYVLGISSGAKLAVALVMVLVLVHSLVLLAVLWKRLCELPTR